MGITNDNFARANQNLAVSGGWATLGAFSQCQVVSNQCSAPNVSGSYFNCRSEGFGDAQFSQATVVSLDASSVLRLIVRCSAALSNAYVAEVQSPSAFIYRLNAGVLTQLSSISASISNNDDIKFQASGSTLSLYQNGSLILSATDSNYISGSVGIGVSVVFTGHIGIWDNWLGGDSITVRNGVFSRDSVLAVGAFDIGIPITYGLFDDDFVAQFDGTTPSVNATQMHSVPAGVFSKDANLDGAFDA